MNYWSFFVSTKMLSFVILVIATSFYFLFSKFDYQQRFIIVSHSPPPFFLSLVFFSIYLSFTFLLFNFLLSPSLYFRFSPYFFLIVFPSLSVCLSSLLFLMVFLPLLVPLYVFLYFFDYFCFCFHTCPYRLPVSTKVRLWLWSKKITNDKIIFNLSKKNHWA